MNDDLISRQAMIEAMNEVYCHIEISKKRPVSKIERDIYFDMRKAVRSLPSVQPKGEWIDYSEDGYVECPFCHSATTCDGNKDELHFCFSCGADMGGEGNDSKDREV